MSPRPHRLTILGCSSSPGVPRIGNDWGACDPANPKNRRRRASAMLEKFGPAGERTIVIIDTGPDFREQMLTAGIQWADAVIYTHPHADHIHGVDDLRAFLLNRRQRTDVWCDEQTSLRLHEGFGYCFKTPEGSSYPPIVNEHRIFAGESFAVDGPAGRIEILPVRQLHGEIDSLGFRVGDLCYSSDISGVPEGSRAALTGLEHWIIDGLRYKPHPSHLSVDEALAVTEELGARHVVLTHMHVDLDYSELSARLPQWAEPAFDGMVIDFVA